jgi:hypothetical protein
MSSSILEQAGDAAGVAKLQAGRVIDGTQKAMISLSHDAKGVIKAQASKQKQMLADDVAQVAKALRAANNTIHQSYLLGSVDYGEIAISRLDDLALSIKNTDIDTMVANTARFARAKPMVFIWAAVAAGFVTARFFKSTPHPS